MKGDGDWWTAYLEDERRQQEDSAPEVTAKKSNLDNKEGKSEQEFIMAPALFVFSSVQLLSCVQLFLTP